MVTRREFFTVTMGTRTSALLATKAEADGGRRHEEQWRLPDGGLDIVGKPQAVGREVIDDGGELLAEVELC